MSPSATRNGALYTTYRSSTRRTLNTESPVQSGMRACTGASADHAASGTTQPAARTAADSRTGGITRATKSNVAIHSTTTPTFNSRKSQSMMRLPAPIAYVNAASITTDMASRRALKEPPGAGAKNRSSPDVSLAPEVDHRSSRSSVHDATIATAAAAATTAPVPASKPSASQMVRRTRTARIAVTRAATHAYCVAKPIPVVTRTSTIRQRKAAQKIAA